MKTEHRLILSDARQMDTIEDQSIDLVVTSPPYPMIEMWDPVFSSLSPPAASALSKGEGKAAFEAMHQILDPVWQECRRVLTPGGFACINIGDATRSISEHFGLYPNHARILTAAHKAGFTVLPCIIWRKQTNAPNKYMGSGMLPAGAYVTLEHEYILILRKGGKRLFKSDAPLRRQSALFWEERNLWFSDVWTDLKGSRQTLKGKAARNRSGAFPFDLAFRLINMYSIQGDRILDPFMGTGTTMAAAMAAGRHSLGIELDQGLVPRIQEQSGAIVRTGREAARQRLSRHLDFVADRTAAKGPLKHQNQPYGFPVMTRQEKELLLTPPREVVQTGELSWTVSHADVPDPDFCVDREPESASPPPLPRLSDRSREKQGSLFPFD